MANVRKWIWVAAVLACGCASGPEVRFVPSGSVAARPAKPIEQVPLFYDEKKIPFDYVELGRVFLTINPGVLENPANQIEMIRAQAAALGADGVLLVPTVASYGNSELSGYRHVVSGESYNLKGQMYSGVVLLKK
jgi:hypothetical protein